MRDRSASSTWAILPVKTVEAAKQRLSNVLSAGERQQLSQEMLADVLAALERSSCLAGLAMVTRDPRIEKLGKQVGARIFKLDIESGQSAAVNYAARTLANEGVDSTVSIPGDVPLTNGAEIDWVCRSIGNSPSLTIVPNADGTGTNSVACSPPGLIPYEFGTDSFARHSFSGGEAAVEVNVLRPPGLCLDIDERDDLIALLRRDLTTRTRTYLIDSGIASRLLSSVPAAATGADL